MSELLKLDFRTKIDIYAHVDNNIRHYVQGSQLEQGTNKLKPQCFKLHTYSGSTKQP